MEMIRNMSEFKNREGEAAKDGVRVLRLGRRGSADAQREQGGLLQNPVSYVYSKLP
jgi:hypothetical protein